MAIVIDSSPDYSFGGSPSVDSYWYSVNNPLIWVVGSLAGVDRVVRVTISNESSVDVYVGLYTQNSLGKVSIRLDTILKELCFLENTFEYGSVNDIEDRISHKFGIYIESGVMNGSTFEAEDHIDKFYRYVVHSVRQIGCIYGSNMAEYVTQDSGLPKAKFLTMFDKPRYWYGYPFCIDFIWNHSEVETDITEDRDPDGSHDYHATTLAYTGKDENVNHVRLNTDYTKSEFSIILSNTDTGLTLSELKRLKVSDESVCNSLYLRWVNELGGTDHWLFNVNQIKKINISDQVVGKVYVADLVNARATHQMRRSRKMLSYFVGTEGLTDNEWDVLSRQFGGSLWVQVYNQVDQEWYNCMIIERNYERNTRVEPYKIEFEILLPEIFNQSI